MDNQEVVKFIKNIFDLIREATTIQDLEKIPDKLDIPSQNRMDINSYPKIEFSISQEEIQSLLDNKILDDDYNFITSKLTDPLTKLLYATSWKNGDLKKIRHIIKGILDSKEESSDPNEAVVFYQFGKYLTKTPGQPIIDQHVIRAYSIYRLTDTAEVEKVRKLEILNKNHNDIINEYKRWLTSDNLTQELRNQKDYTYHIDQLLFAAGKTIKFRKIK